MEAVNNIPLSGEQTGEPDVQLSIAWINDLYRIGRAVSQADSRESSHQSILEHLAQGFAAASGCLSLTEPDGRHLRIVAGLKLPPGVINSTVEFGERILGWVAKNATPLLLNGDVSKDKRFRNLSARSESGIPMVAMCLPLQVEGRVVGVLSLNREVGAKPFQLPDLEHATLIADLVAIVIENAALHAEQASRIQELTRLNERLQEAQSQLLQSEKMASIGQLAAGVAHEINNPVGYVNSNMGTLQVYVNDLFRLLSVYERAEAELPGDSPVRSELEVYRQAIDINFLREDTLNLVKESQEGLTRVRKIVQDLKEFSHVNRAEWQEADLHAGLDSTLNIVNNEVKYKAEVIKDYGEIPLVQCIPSQLNQVFMNLLVNAAHAIETRGIITIRTGTVQDEVFIEIRDTGQGMPPEVAKRIFEPFFTTKPVGKGTGLGLSLAYGIVQKHLGRIEVESEPGRGTAFRVWVPTHQKNKPMSKES